MYEKFSDRARKVRQLANQDAQRRNHEYVGTEHILMALVKEGSGVASVILKNLDIDFCKVRLEIERLVQEGPPMITLEKLPQTPRAKKVFEYAIEESKNLKHNYVGTEHILLGLLREKEGIAAQILNGLGANLENVHEGIIRILGEAKPHDDKKDHPEFGSKGCLTEQTSTSHYIPGSFGAGLWTTDKLIGEIKESGKQVDVHRLLKKIKPLLQQILDAMEEEGL